MAERENPQEFTGEDLKNLFRAGFAVLKKKGGEVISKIGHEMDPDVRVEKYIQRKFDQLTKAGLKPEHAKKVIAEHVDGLLQK